MSRARTLRRNSTQAEQKLWRLLRNPQRAGLKFRRQQPSGPYVADFVCFEARLIVEVDGGQHVEGTEAESRRTRWLEAQGFHLLRFWNNDVLGNPDGVAEAIERAVNSPHPLPSGRSPEGRDLSHKGRG